MVCAVTQDIMHVSPVSEAEYPDMKDMADSHYVLWISLRYNESRSAGIATHWTLFFRHHRQLYTILVLYQEPTAQSDI